MSSRPELHEARDIGDAFGLANRALCLLWFAEEILACDPGSREAQDARTLALSQARTARAQFEDLLAGGTLGELRRWWALEVRTKLRELDELDDPVVAVHRVSIIQGLFRRLDRFPDDPPIFDVADDLVRALPPRARELFALIVAAPRDPATTSALDLVRRLEFAEVIQDFAEDWSFYIRWQYAEMLHPDYVRAVFPPALHPENIGKLPRVSINAPTLGTGSYVMSSDVEKAEDSGGFYYSIKLTVEQLIANIDDIFAHAPITEIRVEGDLTGDAGRVLDHPHLHQLWQLHHKGKLDDAAVERLVRQPWPNLKELFLSEGTPAHIRAVAAAAANFPALTSSHFGASETLFRGKKFMTYPYYSVYGEGEPGEYIEWYRSAEGERLFEALGKPGWFPYKPYYFRHGPDPSELPD